MSSLVYLNGEYTPLSEARIPVMDRGFLFGDSVYEVIPCYHGHPFRLDHHLKRLAGSLAAIGMENPLPRDDWRRIIEQLTQQYWGEDQSLYIQVSRGSSGHRSPAIPKGIAPTIFAMTQCITYPDPNAAAVGMAATTHDDIRWQRCNIKATTLLANILLRDEAQQQGSAEAILIRDGHAVEGASSNLFIVENGVIITPPESNQLLPGVTRDLVLELAASHGLPSCKADIPLASLFSADEVWITSSSREVMAIVEVDGKKVGNGEPGPIYRLIRNHYIDYKATLPGADSENLSTTATE